MIHNATNLVSKTYKPSYIYSKNISNSTQNLDQNTVPYIIVESGSDGIDSIINEINTGSRLPNDSIPKLFTSQANPVYDSPKSVFSVSELLDPETFGILELDTVTYTL